MLKVYGLKNCDTCRKALKWLEAEDIPFEFMDIRGDTRLSAADIAIALDQVGAEKFVNRRGTTWRKLSDAEKEKTGPALVTLLESEPAIMKRPIFCDAKGYFVGFDKAAQDRLR